VPTTAPIRTDLTLEAATRIVDGALELRKRYGLLPLTVAVLDAGGHPVVLKRKDGSGIRRAEIALGKAWGALGMGMSSRGIRDRLADQPTFQAALAASSHGRFIPVPGGVLILDDAGQVIGAVGISGDTSDRDEFCAIEAVRAAGLTPEPLAPQPEWQGKAG
jgi:uncharacterized protein GlcG (DUF336 family)